MNEKTDIILLSGNTMPVIGLGTWKLDDAGEAVESAIDLGYRMIDTAGNYGTQRGIGKAIKRSGVDREDLFIVTKVENTEDAYEATRRNLEELQIAYADLVLIHWPPEEGVGEDLWRGLIRAKSQGLAKDIGVSNYSVEQIDELYRNTAIMPAINQVEWSPFGYQLDMLNYCKEHHIALQAYSPLTRGDKLNEKHLVELAEEYGKTPAQILIRWNLQLGTVPIVKAHSEEHQQENIDVFNFELKEADMEMLKSLNEEYSSLMTEMQY